MSASDVLDGVMKEAADLVKSGMGNADAARMALGPPAVDELRAAIADDLSGKKKK